MSRFRSITAVDLDPLAPILFRLNHGLELWRSGAALRFERVDLFGQLEAILAAHKDHAVLFSNVLGQHLFHEPDAARAEDTISSMKHRLAGRHWASWHDRLSGRFPPRVPLPEARMTRLALEAAALAAECGLSGEWVDHLTAHVLPEGTERHLLAWPLLADWLHIVEFGIVHPA